MENYFAKDEIEIKELQEGTDSEVLNESYVVAIGASAGGLDPINKFFESITENTGAAFILIQHLSPDYKSLMKELLAKHTAMNVYVAEQDMLIESNNIYLIPPGKSMTMKDNKLQLADRDASKNLILPIDTFFHSLAKDKKEKAIAVILSGSGSDGSEGIKSIKENGGLIMVQDPETAQFTSMPKSALSTGLVDYVLLPSQMPTEIVHFINGDSYNEAVNSEPDNNDESNYSDELYMKILNTIKEYTSIDFFHYKKATVMRRIERRMAVYGINSALDYLNYINSNPHEIVTLYKDFFIGVTNFFRDSEAFQIIEKEVIPRILEKKTAGVPIRIWAAGCSTGEEAYSIAILLREYMNRVFKECSVKIFATDIDDEALNTASRGIYSSKIENHVSPERLRNFFTKKGDTYQVNKGIRDMVVFAKHNLIIDPPFSKLDFIVCRNLLIYLQPQVQQNILSSFNFSLNQNGYLFLGVSEAIGEAGKFFFPLSSKWKIYNYNGESKLARLSSFSINRIGSYIQERSSSLLAYNSTRSVNYTEKSIGKILQQLQEAFIPRGVIIDESYEVVHVIGDVNNYIRIPTNNLSLNILKMIRQDLSIAVSTAIHNVLKEAKELKYRNIRVNNLENYFDITLTVKPFIDGATDKKFVVILFEEKIIENKPQNEENFEIHSKIYQRITDLEQELKLSNENLQAVIEELESSNEELQATNEELLSSNEELQSTNEELQSVNEELYTVNSEYQANIQELTEAHDDITSLLSITGISTIFLDRNLCIRRFTPAVKKEINIIDSDIGRPISHISCNIKYDNLIEDIHDVLSSMVPKEKVVKGLEETWHKVSILPYIADSNMLRGIVLHIKDITDIKNKDSQMLKLLNEKEVLHQEYIAEISELNKRIQLLTAQIEAAATRD